MEEVLCHCGLELQQFCETRGGRRFGEAPSSDKYLRFKSGDVTPRPPRPGSYTSQIILLQGTCGSPRGGTITHHKSWAPNHPCSVGRFFFLFSSLRRRTPPPRQPPAFEHMCPRVSVGSKEFFPTDTLRSSYVGIRRWVAVGLGRPREVYRPLAAGAVGPPLPPSSAENLYLPPRRAVTIGGRPTDNGARTST